MLSSTNNPVLFMLAEMLFILMMRILTLFKHGTISPNYKYKKKIKTHIVFFQ